MNNIIEKNYVEMSGRSVIDVITQILPIIPDKEKELKQKIQKYKASQSHRAPEVLIGSICLVPFIDMLNSHITEFDEEWKIQMRTIINNN